MSVFEVRNYVLCHKCAGVVQFPHELWLCSSYLFVQLSGYESFSSENTRMLEVEMVGLSQPIRWFTITSQDSFHPDTDLEMFKNVLTAD